jgi:hypothetical protein
MFHEIDIDFPHSLLFSIFMILYNLQVSLLKSNE